VRLPSPPEKIVLRDPTRTNQANLQHDGIPFVRQYHLVVIIDSFKRIGNEPGVNPYL
jgi:hypothetical protein